MQCPAIVRLASGAVGARESEIPDGVECVEFEFSVVELITIWIDEDFKVIVVKDDGVAGADCASHVWFLEFSGDVEGV
ncbi:MAG: hypothetical protein RL215_1153 [Planctomycetota bacterium]